MAKDFYGDEIPPGGHEISKLWLAMKALDRREFDECLGYCNAVLEKNPYDQVRPPPRSFSSSMLTFIIPLIPLTSSHHSILSLRSKCGTSRRVV